MNTKSIFHPTISLAIVTIFLISCDKYEYSGDVIQDPVLKENLYSMAKDTISLGNKKFKISSDLSRNFFPSGLAPKKKHPLVAFISLQNIDSIAIPQNIGFGKLYVINDELIWKVGLSSGNRNVNADYQLEGVSNDGPEWGTNILVDVVVEIKNSDNNQSYYLINRDVKILRLD